MLPRGTSPNTVCTVFIFLVLTVMIAIVFYFGSNEIAYRRNYPGPAMRFPTFTTMRLPNKSEKIGEATRFPTFTTMRLPNKSEKIGEATRFPTFTTMRLPNKSEKIGLSENASRFNRTRGRNCLKSYFNDVVLIIVYHYPLYDSIPSILSIYQEAFSRIVVCGPTDSKDFEIMVLNMGVGGYYSYECIGKAMRLYPGYRGYLYVNDDMVVNWWNFARFDKDKIWPGAPIKNENAHEVGHRPISQNWYWWPQPNGAVSCERTLRKIDQFGSNYSMAVNFGELMTNYLRNGDGRKLCFNMWSDFAYIPGRLSRQFRFLSSIFFKNSVFLEIAVPTILNFLENRTSWEKLYGTYLPDLYGFRDFTPYPKLIWSTYSMNSLFVHPVKFSGDKGETNRKVLETRVKGYAKNFTNC